MWSEPLEIPPPTSPASLPLLSQTRLQMGRALVVLVVVDDGPVASDEGRMIRRVVS